jgi:ElaB/YqjD/DUF883 family membrane-anchored ribosome-binding protein
MAQKDAKNIKSVITQPSSNYSEIDDIREDIVSLKSNIADLTSHLKKDGVKQTKVLKNKAQDTYEQAKISGKEQVDKVEEQVKQKPLESIAIAFATGVVASLILGRR